MATLRQKNAKVILTFSFFPFEYIKKGKGAYFHLDFYVPFEYRFEFVVDSQIRDSGSRLFNLIVLLSWSRNNYFIFEKLL